MGGIQKGDIRGKEFAAFQRVQIVAERLPCALQKGLFGLALGGLEEFQKIGCQSREAKASSDGSFSSASINRGDITNNTKQIMKLVLVDIS